MQDLLGFYDLWFNLQLKKKLRRPGRSPGRLNFYQTVKPPSTFRLIPVT
jgi:hypothetical protein